MSRSWAILAGLAVLLCLGGCAPKVGQKRLLVYFDRDGRASIIEVTVGRMIRVPVLDRQTPAAGETDDGPDVSR